MLKKIKNYNYQAYTLIEMITVIGIIIFIATIGVVTLKSSRASANNAKRLDSINKFKKAAFLYRMDNPNDLAPGYVQGLNNGTGDNDADPDLDWYDITQLCKAVINGEDTIEHPAGCDIAISLEKYLPKLITNSGSSSDFDLTEFANWGWNLFGHNQYLCDAVKANNLLYISPFPIKIQIDESMENHPTDPVDNYCGIPIDYSQPLGNDFYMELVVKTFLCHNYEYALIYKIDKKTNDYPPGTYLTTNLWTFQVGFCCGNGVCEADVGETVENCNSDCI